MKDKMEDKLKVYEVVPNSSWNAVLYEKKEERTLSKVIHLLHTKLNARYV